MSCVINPNTGRAIKTGTAYYKKLMKEGKLGDNPVERYSKKKQSSKPKAGRRNTNVPKASASSKRTIVPKSPSIYSTPSSKTSPASSSRTMTDSPASAPKSRVIGNFSGAKPRMLFGRPYYPANYATPPDSTPTPLKKQAPRRSTRKSVSRVLFNPRTGQ